MAYGYYGIIYKATNLLNKKVYIGYTSRTLEERKRWHRLDSFNRNADDYNVHFHNAIRKYGLDNFKWEILGYCNSREELKEAEIECVWLYRSFGSDGKNWDKIYGYNLTPGGDGTAGLKWTDEQRQNLCEQRKEYYKTHAKKTGLIITKEMIDNYSKKTCDNKNKVLQINIIKICEEYLLKNRNLKGIVREDYPEYKYTTVYNIIRRIIKAKKAKENL